MPIGVLIENDFFVFLVLQKEIDHNYISHRLLYNEHVFT